MPTNGKLYQFINCNILSDHKIIQEDIWVRNGKIVDPEKIFFDEKISADVKIDCANKLIVPVTDAISALGLQAGQHKIGQLDIEVKDNKAFIAGTSTLCGSVASMIQCVRNFIKSTGCSPEYAFEAASFHPALALGIEKNKGSLSYGADADFIMLTDDYDISSTWIDGECVYSEGG
ncbi:hypothetical protein D910_02972, partial [Dendroctonus ponderosae]